RRRLIWRTWLVVALFDCIKVDLKRGVRLVARSPCYCRWCIKGLGVVSAANLCQHPFLDGFSTFHCFTRTTPSICDVSERTRLTLWEEVEALYRTLGAVSAGAAAAVVVVAVEKCSRHSLAQSWLGWPLRLSSMLSLVHQ